MLNRKKAEECKYREGLNAKAQKTQREKSVSVFMRGVRIKYTDSMYYLHFLHGLHGEKGCSLCSQ